LKSTLWGGSMPEFTSSASITEREQDDETQFWFKWDYFEENVPARIKEMLAGMCCA